MRLRITKPFEHQGVTHPAGKEFEVDGHAIGENPYIITGHGTRHIFEPGEFTYVDEPEAPQTEYEKGYAKGYSDGADQAKEYVLRQVNALKDNVENQL